MTGFIQGKDRTCRRHVEGVHAHTKNVLVRTYLVGTITTKGVVLDVEIPQDDGVAAEHAPDFAPRLFPPQLGIRQVEVLGALIDERSENRHPRRIA